MNFDLEHEVGQTKQMSCRILMLVRNACQIVYFRLENLSKDRSYTPIFLSQSDTCPFL